MRYFKYIFFIIIIFYLGTMSPQCFGEQSIKRPNVSGQFYPASALQLSSQIKKLVDSADIVPYDKHVDIIISPHAGYVYSGGVAAYGFKAASQNRYKTVIVVAPSHHLSFNGISVGLYDGMQTPLGVVPVNKEMAQQLIDMHELFNFEARAFAREHSLEVEIPFLQEIFHDFDIVPIITGQLRFETIEIFAKALERLIGDRKDVLLVISTDLSHFHTDQVARKKDLNAIDSIKNMKIEDLWNGHVNQKQEMCGVIPVLTSLVYAKNKGLGTIDVLKYANSGDVTGDKDRVVGYTSIVIHNNEPIDLKDSLTISEGNEVAPLTMEQKRRLMAIAKSTMHEYILNGQTLDFKETDPRFLQKEGAFVTIHKKGRLRGCIGHIVGQQPLYKTVRDMAISAATQDPRFPKVTPKELDVIDLEISVLSIPWRIKDVSEIEMGKHGVIVSKGFFKRGVFLPQVATETGWSREEFLSHLCSQKAGLSPDAWKYPSTIIEIFTADVFSENDLK